MTEFKRVASVLGIFCAILIAAHFYLYQRMGYYLPLDAGQRFFMGGGLGLLALLTIIAIPLSRAFPSRLTILLLWVIYPWMGFALLLVTGFLVTDIIWLSAWMTLNPRPSLKPDMGIAAMAAAIGLGLYALWNGLRPARIRRVTVDLKKLPSALDGLRIIQISDLHIGPMLGGKWLQRMVDRINALDPDIIAITGDLVDGAVSELRDDVAPLGGLRAKHGIYFVTGNHEYYSGVGPWCDYIASLGIEVLRNRYVSIMIGDRQIDIAGVDDWTSRHFPGETHDLTSALAGRDQTNPVILLAHQPIMMHEAAAQGVDLQLSGHTHAGQIWPFTYFIYLQQPVAYGLARHATSDLQLYVSSGTGFWGPPMRLGTRAEITHLTLRAAPSHG